MRFLIDRYSSPINTECLYIHNELIKNGYVAKIREYNENIFDVFNLFKPDVYISSCGTISAESLICVKRFDSTMILSDDTESLSQFLLVKDKIADEGVQCKTFMINPNTRKKTEKNKKGILLFPAAIDSNLSQHIKKVDFYRNAENLIVVESGLNKELIKNLSTFNSLSRRENILCDINTRSIVNPLTIIHNYKRVIFCSNGISQLFLECFIRHDNVMLSAQDSSQKNRLSDILSKHFYITENVFYEEDHKDIGKEDRDKILEVVMDRHTPENRLKRIISQLQ